MWILAPMNVGKWPYKILTTTCQTQLHLCGCIIYENQDQFAQWLEKKIGHWNSEKNIAIKKIPTVQKCFKVVERHCLKNLSDLLKC